MSTLQITMVCIWVVIILGGIYWLGSQFGSGWQAILGFGGLIVYYGGCLALGYFTLKALIGF